jgi:hypothetical protein
MHKFLAVIIGLFGALMLVACEPPAQSNDNKIAIAQAQAVGGLEARVGQPRITNGTEMRLMNRIYELRDQPNLQTFTYRSDLNGQLHCIGRSIGYGLPYAAQRTNPERIAINNAYGSLAIPQPEANGLFMPDSASATWVLLIGPNGQPSPVYVEDDVTVSTFPLQNVKTQCT